MACGIDGPVPLPPPPAEATASCVYEVTPPFDVGVPTSTLWFNGLGQTIRIDGDFFGRNGRMPAAYYVTYDDQGRIVEERGEYGDIRYDYTPQQITVTADRWPGEIYSLVERRVVHAESPGVPVEKQLIRDYTYDSAGRLASYSVTDFHDEGEGTMKFVVAARYAYDPQGRVVTLQIMKNGKVRSSSSLTYSETADRLVITVDDGSLFPARWTYDFDASHRVIRSAVKFLFDTEDAAGPDDVVDVYSYVDGEIVESFPGSDATIRAIGACPPPAVVVAPEAPLPIRLHAEHVSLSNEAAFAYGFIDLPR